MTNLEKWQGYTSGLPSPQNYIDWGYRYLISACLQRRVWCPPKHRPCYPNLYPILVGRPGIGKGQVIKSVEEVLRFHKLEVNDNDQTKGTPEERMIAEKMAEADLKAAQEVENNGTNGAASTEKPLLIPMAANATTYEALVQHMSRCLRRINYFEDDPATGAKKMKIYSHSSLCFCLEEIASLFRKNTHDVINFLLETYDCNENYEYSTKTKGKDRIRRVCLNLFGGTTPDFMQRTFDDGLLNQGFSSRAFFIYANKNRKTIFFIPELTNEQAAYREEIIKYVKGLTKLHGQVTLDTSTINFLQDWWETYEKSPQLRASQSRKMEAYYSRKNIHVMKVAMATHFGETLDMHIPKARFEEAIEILEQEEKTMHMALTMECDNPLANASAAIVQYLTIAGEKTFNELLAEFWGKVRRNELEEILEFLGESKQVKSTVKSDSHTNESLVFYSAMKQSSL